MSPPSGRTSEVQLGEDHPPAARVGGWGNVRILRSNAQKTMAAVESFIARRRVQAERRHMVELDELREHLFGSFVSTTPLAERTTPPPGPLSSIMVLASTHRARALFARWARWVQLGLRRRDRDGKWQLHLLRARWKVFKARVRVRREREVLVKVGGNA